MRQISTGLGLAVLGGGIFGAAALSSPWLIKSAEASDSQTVPTMAGRRTWSSPVEQLRGVPARSSLTACAVRTENWFNPTPHEIEECAEFPSWMLPGLPGYRPADILGDRTLRWIALSGSTADENASLVVMEVQHGDDGSTTFSGIRVVSPEHPELNANIRAIMGGGLPEPTMNSLTWMDMDQDGDLDLVVGYGPRAWFENTAGHATQANPYDHDGNGSVNTADLSLLLLNFD